MPIERKNDLYLYENHFMPFQSRRQNKKLGKLFKFWLFYFQNTLDLLEHVHLNEVGGAAGIDHGLSSDHQEWGVDSGLDFLDFPDLLLEAERSSLEFYKV